MYSCIEIVVPLKNWIMMIATSGFHIGFSDTCRYEHRPRELETCMQNLKQAFQTCSDGDDSVLPFSNTNGKPLSDNNA